MKLVEGFGNLPFIPEAGNPLGVVVLNSFNSEFITRRDFSPSNSTPSGSVMPKRSRM